MIWNMPRFDVLTIGSATQDVFVRSQALEMHHDNSSPDGIAACFAMGAKMGIDELTFASGGGATNAAVTFARFGLKTACLSRIGTDVTAGQVMGDLKKEKIDTRFMQVDAKEKTAYSVILLSGTGHRAIFTHRGASAQLDRTSFPWHHWAKKLSGGKIANWIYLTSVGGDLNVLKDIFAHAESSRTKIAWNPGNRELEFGLKKLKPFIEQTDILSLNTEEAALLGGLSAIGDLPRGAFLLTEGSKGALVRVAGKNLRAHSLKKKLVNTTGAGDAFGSAFVAAWIKTKQDPRASLAVAMLNATGVITHMGAKAGILPRFPNKNEFKHVSIR